MPVINHKYHMVTATINDEEVTFPTVHDFDEAMHVGFFRIKASEDLREFLNEGRQFARTFTGLPKYNQFGVLDVVNGYLQSATAQTVRFTLEESNWSKTHINQVEVENGESNYSERIQILGRKMKTIGMQVLKAILRKFGIPEELWARATAGAVDGEGSNYLLFNSYQSKLASRPVGVGEHKDWGYITVLDATQPGLEAFIDNEFRLIEMEDGYLTINFGEPLQKLLPGVNASLHRVGTQQIDRQSTVMFIDPKVGSYSKSMSCLLRNSSAQDKDVTEAEKEQGHVYDWDAGQKKLTHAEPTIAYFTRLSQQLYGADQSGKVEEATEATPAPSLG